MKTLKRITLLLIIAIAVASCKKDDDNSTSASLIGTWKIVSETYNGEREALDVCELKSTVTFTETKVNAVEYDGENCEQMYTSVQNYTRDGNIITVTDGSYSHSVEITKLNASTLEITDRDDGDVSVQTYARQ